MGMTLIAAKDAILKPQIKAALDSVVNAAQGSADSGSQSIDMNQVHQDLADALGEAIHAYVTQAVVNTFINTAVIGVGGGVPGPMVGTGLGVGNGKLI